jgi:hypothetical protein
MGIAYRIAEALDCTVVVWDGNITKEEHAEHLVRLAADTQWPPGGFHLTDLTTVTNVTLPDPELVDVLIEGTQMREHVEKVIIVRPAFLRATCIEESGAALGGIPKQFSDLDRACAHLGVSAGTVRATIDELREELTTE